MPSPSTELPAELAPYLGDLVARARAVLGERLVGVYAGGSVALGAYTHGSSDVDVSVVVRDTLERATKDALVAALRHEALPCPARGLELVVYTLATTRRGGVEPGFELNLNTGATMGFHADEAPRPEGGEHWFAIDRSLLRSHGLALTGPPAAQTFAEVPRPAMLTVLGASLEWHRLQGAGEADNSVLNACRTLRFVREGVWSSKPEAGAWALDRVSPSALVAAALAARTGGPPPDAAAAEAFVAWVADEIARELRVVSGATSFSARAARGRGAP